ncbi:MAG: hypothetical protein LBQ22_12985 [Bacteroidales bacterium]|jgi:hypothetical protein|nr:hypothetical protein [Bacteroidales bacterium]
MGHPCKENSKYKMWIGFEGEKPNIIRYSFPTLDKRGAEYQFNYMYQNLLSKQFNHNYNCTYFIEVATDIKLKKVEKGGVITNL